MTYSVLWGANVHNLSGPTWNYGSEEAADASSPPHTFKRNWDLARVYMDGGQGSALAGNIPNAGLYPTRSLYLTVGKFTFANSCTATSVNGSGSSSQAAWDSFFDSLLGFGGNALAAGSKVIYFDLQHEMDSTNSRFGSAAEYIAYYRRVRARYTAALARHSITVGSAGDRVRIGWMPTEWSMRGYKANGTCIAASYWPEDSTHTGLVDFCGSDGYNQSGWAFNDSGGFKPGSWRPFAQVFADTEKWAIDHGKPLMLGEVATVEWDWSPANGPGPTYHSSGSGTNYSSGAQWWLDAGTHILSMGQLYLGVCLFIAGNGTTGNGANYRFDWGFDSPNRQAKHEGVRQAIINSQAVGNPTTPSNPTNLAATSGLLGTTAVLTWGAFPGGETVTGLNFWIQDITNGNVPFGSAFATNQSPVLSSYTFTGLTPGHVYKCQMTKLNSTAPPSGFASTYATVTTVVPPVNQAPSITAFTATPDTANPSLVTFSVSWSDPNNNSCTIVINADPNNPSATPITIGPTASATVTGTYTYQKSGTYSPRLTVTNTGLPPLSSSATTSVTISLADSFTTNYNWPRLLGGTVQLKALSSVISNFQDQVDASLYQVAQQVSLSPHNAILGLAASNFDPVSIGGSTSNTPGINTFQWHKMQVQLPTVSAITCWVATAQTGTGSQMAIYSGDGQTQLGLATGVDTALTNTGVQIISCPLDPATFNPGDILIVGFYCPLSTGPAIRTSPATLYASGPLTAAQGYRSGFLSSQSGCPSTIAFGGNQSAAFWFGLIP